MRFKGVWGSWNRRLSGWGLVAVEPDGVGDFHLVTSSNRVALAALQYVFLGRRATWNKASREGVRCHVAGRPIFEPNVSPKRPGDPA